jgi:hypothetical protein
MALTPAGEFSRDERVIARSNLLNKRNYAFQAHHDRTSFAHWSMSMPEEIQVSARMMFLLGREIAAMISDASPSPYS